MQARSDTPEAAHPLCEGTPPLDPLRIAVFTDTFLPQVNGVVRSIVSMANELVARGHRVAVFTMEFDKLHDAARGGFDGLAEGIEVYPFRSVGLPGFREIQARIPTVLRPLRVARRFNPDVIHLHTIFTMGWEAIWIARLLCRPLVGSHHGLLTEYLSNFGLDFEASKRWMRRFLAFYYNRCSAVVTPAQVLRRELLQHGLERQVHVISNPLDLGLFSPPSGTACAGLRVASDGHTLMHVGRLVRQKSVDVLLRAYALLRGDGVSAKLVIVGDGRERPALEMLAQSLGIADGVTWAGLLSGVQLVERIASGDVFVSASTTEVQPLCFIEAMALGLPVVGVNAGGVPELIQHGRSGLVVEPNNPRALAEAMRVLLSSPEQCARFAVHARRQAVAFDARRVVPEFESVYCALIDGRRPARAA